MHTTVHIDGANCSICFDEALDGLGQLAGVTAVHGSIAGSCIEVDHDDVALDVALHGCRPRPPAQRRDVLQRDPDGAPRSGRGLDTVCPSMSCPPVSVGEGPVRPSRW